MKKECDDKLFFAQEIQRIILNLHLPEKQASLIDKISKVEELFSHDLAGKLQEFDTSINDRLTDLKTFLSVQLETSDVSIKERLEDSKREILENTNIGFRQATEQNDSNDQQKNSLEILKHARKRHLELKSFIKRNKDALDHNLEEYSGKLKDQFGKEFARYRSDTIGLLIRKI